MISLKKIVTFLKKRWQYLAIFFGGVIAIIAFRRQGSSDDQKSLRDSRDKHLDDIDNIRHVERDKQDQASQKLETDLKVIQNQYEQQKKDFDEQKKEEIKEVLKSYKDDPAGLAKKLSEVTGFKIIMPEE